MAHTVVLTGDVNANRDGSATISVVSIKDTP
jgi:hypothetical protein